MQTDPFEEYDLDPDNDLPVNPDELDVEWAVQDDVIKKYGEAAADANKRAKQAHERVKTIRSTLVLEANKNPDVMGKGVKPTAPNVEAYYRSNEEYQEAKEEMIQLEYEAEILSNAKSRAYNRKHTLQELTKLALMGWFAVPQEPRELSELIRKAEERAGEQANGKVRDAINKKKKMRRGTKK